jgi:hypothetical protein
MASAMSADPGDGPDSSVPELFRQKYVIRLSHRGRVVRILVALLLTVPGWLPIPYIGWAHGVIFFGPAAALLAIAAMERKSLRVVLLWSIPTAAGTALSLFSLAVYSTQGSSGDLILRIIGIAIVTTLFVALLGVITA